MSDFSTVSGVKGLQIQCKTMGFRILSLLHVKVSRKMTGSSHLLTRTGKMLTDRMWENPSFCFRNCKENNCGIHIIRVPISCLKTGSPEPRKPVFSTALRARNHRPSSQNFLAFKSFRGFPSLPSIWIAISCMFS